MDNIRYSYSPAFEAGWAIGIRLDTEVEIGMTSSVVNGGHIVSKVLANDAFLSAADLPSELMFSPDDRPLKEIHWRNVVEAASEICISPAPFPWASCDGALSALHVKTGDTTFTLEWNTMHPEEWKGLEQFHELMEQLFKQHPLANRGEQDVADQRTATHCPTRVEL